MTITTPTMVLRKFSLPVPLFPNIGRMTITTPTTVLGKFSLPVPLFPPQIPHGLAWDQTPVFMVTWWQLTS